MFPANGLYGHIRNNALKSALLLAGFVVLIGVYWWAGCLSFVALLALYWPSPVQPQPMNAQDAFWQIVDAASKFAVAHWIVPVVIATVWFVVAWIFHRQLVRAATGAKPVERREATQLYNLVENLSISAGLPMPRIEIIETGAMNAYAAGLTPSRATIAVTRGLIDKLTPAELEAVLAHEMTHIKNGDVQLMMVAVIFAGGISLLGDLAGSFFGRGDGVTVSPRFTLSGSGSGGNEDNQAGRFTVFGALMALAVGVIVMGLAQVFAVLSQFALSRSREYMADAGAVELTKNPDALISALRRISQDDEVPLVSEGMRAMMISRADDCTGAIEALVSSHPSIDDRVACLERFAGGHEDVQPREQVRAGSTPDARSQTSVWGQPPVFAAGVLGARASVGRRA